MAIVALVGIGRARADEASGAAEHALGVGFGYARIATLDDAASRLPYAANTFTGSVGYVGRVRSWRFGLRTRVAYGPESAVGVGARRMTFAARNPDGTLDETIVPMRGSRLTGLAETHLAYLRRRPAFDVFVGGSAEFAVVRPDGFVAPGLMQRFGAGPMAGLRVRLHPRQAIELEARTALVTWRSRLPYHQSVSWPDSTAYEGFVRQGSALRSFVSMQSFDALASYRIEVRRHLALRAEAGVSLVHDSLPRALRSTEGRLLLHLDVLI